MSDDPREVKMAAAEGTKRRHAKVIIGGCPEWRFLMRLLVLANGFPGSETQVRTLNIKIRVDPRKPPKALRSIGAG